MSAWQRAQALWIQVRDDEDSLRGVRNLSWWVMLPLALFRRLADGQLSLLAMSLAYTTLLSLVPMLAVSFSVLKGFGVHNQLEPVLTEALLPLGEQGITVRDNILAFVNNLDVRVLGYVGIGFLFYTVFSLLQKVEQSLNTIWEVPETRSLRRRFSDYLSVVLVGPVLVFSGIGLANTLLESALISWLTGLTAAGWLLGQVGRIVPFLFIAAGFAFAYMFMVNTRVRVAAAMAGGFAAGVLWYASAWLFAALVVTSSNYSAIYSGFAAAVLFIVWLNLGWMIILFGAQLAYYWQFPARVHAGGRVSGARRREQLAMELMALIAGSHASGTPLWTAEQLGQRYPAQAPVEEVLECLLRSGLVLQSDDPTPRLLPGRAADSITLREVVDAVRSDSMTPALPEVAACMESVEAALHEALAGRTVATLLREEVRVDPEGDGIKISQKSRSSA